MNTIVLIGNMTRNPELRTITSGKAVCNFTLAVNRPWKTDEVDYVRCQAWGAVAENTAQFCTKGSKVAVLGRLQIRQYTPDDGEKKTIAEVVANNVQFLDSKKKEQDFGGTEVTESDVPF